MEIRKKLTLQFTAIVAVILFIASLSVYISFSQGRKEEFFGRLESKAKLVAQMLMEIDGIDMEMLRRIEKNNPLSLPNEKIIIYDYLNRVIYSSDEDDVLRIPHWYLDKARIEKKIRYSQQPFEVLGSFHTGEFDRIIVFVAATDIFGYSKLYKLRIILLIVFITSMIIVYFAGRMFAARALKPVTKIISEVNAIGINNISERISQGNDTDELARLAKTFNGMLDRLETAFTSQKSFIANASHELRTPLTVIIGQLEVALMKVRSNEEYAGTMGSVLSDIKNLSLLSNRLLMLAQASSDMGDDNMKPLRIDDVLWNVRAELIKRKPDYLVNISFSEAIADETMLMVSGNELLLKTAIINLMENACKYSADATSDVVLDAEPNSLTLRFRDKGIGIPEDEVSLIFEPFFRARNSIGVKGHGIGLSLVDKIVNQHQGTIAVQSKLGEGSDFMVMFPVFKTLN
jgi:signal transduction histidine kinase